MTSGKWFGFSLHFFSVSDIFLLSMIHKILCAKIRFSNDFRNSWCHFSSDFYIFLCLFSNEIHNSVAFFQKIASISSEPKSLKVYCWNMPKFSMEILSEKSISQVYGIRFLLHHHVGINSPAHWHTVRLSGYVVPQWSETRAPLVMAGIFFSCRASSWGSAARYLHVQPCSRLHSTPPDDGGRILCW